MPLYEYRCRGCAHAFEALIRADDAPACPSCGATDLERLVSMFAVDSDGTRQVARAKSMPAARGVHREKERGEREDHERLHR
jgi:putative FmdB family regulatory protein